MVNNKRIFGSYALVNYSNTTNNSRFWVANPGLVMLGQAWDININGYIPFGSKKKLSDEVWADDLLGLDSFNTGSCINFVGHDEYAHRFQVFEKMGNGFGTEVGRVIPHLTKAKLYLGGYHFDTKDMGSINGTETRLDKANFFL